MSSDTVDLAILALQSLVVVRWRVGADTPLATAFLAENLMFCNAAATAALAMALLHRADGGEVRVFPNHVTSLHAKAPSSAANKVVIQEARCVLWLADGKTLAVLETCETVRKLLEEATR
jgi:hypothetical protein